MKMKIQIEGKFTEGYYNDMEAGYPVFIDEQSLSTVVKDELKKMGLSYNFCDNAALYDPSINTLENNKLIGKKVTLTLEWS